MARTREYEIVNAPLSEGGDTREQGFTKLDNEMDRVFTFLVEDEAHKNSTSNPHNVTATQVAVTPAGNILSDTVQEALEELDTEKVSVAQLQDYSFTPKTVDIITKGPWVDVRAFGAVGDGVTNDTVAIQAAFDTLTNNKTVFFPPGKYLITSNITLSNKTNVRIIGLGATIYETSGALTGNLYFTNCNNVIIDGLSFEAGEDYAYFAANNPSEERSFIYFSACLNSTVTNITGKNKRRLITFYNSEKSIISNFNFLGFFQNVSLGLQAQANNAPCVTIKGSHYSSASNGHVYNTGSAVLVQSTSTNINITNISGKEFHDNGIYLSSAQDSSVTSCAISNVIGDGVQTRGYNITVSGCAVNNSIAGAGVSMTGLSVADSFGAGGYGAVCANNVIQNCLYGVRFGSAYGLFMRDITVIGNTIINSTITGTNGAIEIGSNVGGIICSDNIVQTTASDMGISINNGGSGTCTGIVVSNNFISGVNGLNATTRGGIRLSGVARFSASGNVFSSISCNIGVRVLGGVDGVIFGNVFPGQTVARVVTGESSSNVFLANNYGASVYNSETACGVGTNFVTSSNSYPATSTIPKFLGQQTISGTTAYIATGTSATTDWKQIT